MRKIKFNSRILLFFFMFLIYLVKSQSFLTEKNKTDVSLAISYVKEIENIEELKIIINEKRKFFIEFYSPTCEHCIKFAAKYEFLAKTYQGKIDFYRINGIRNKNYSEFVQVKVFPSLFLFELNRFYQYKGLMKIDYLHNFIENVYLNECIKIEKEQTLFNFINDNSKSSYVLGVFRKEEKHILQLFTDLYKENRMIIENCYYYINQNIKRDSPPFIYNMFYMDNFILAYNQKKFNTFSDFSILIENLKQIKSSSLNENSDFINEPELENEFEILRNQTSISYRKFLMENLFSEYEEWGKNKLNFIKNRSDYVIFFLFQNEEERILIEKIIGQYQVILNGDIFIENFYRNIPIILVDLNLDNSKIFKSDKIGHKTGFYISDVNLITIDGINESELLNLQNLINLLKNYFNPAKKSSLSVKISDSSINSKKINTTFLHENTIFTIDTYSFSKYLIYLITYTGIFYIIYKKYLSSIKVEIKEN